MIKGEEDLGGGQVSIAWQGGALDQGDPILERAAAFATVLAQTLTNAGYQARNLAVGVRREGPRDVLHLHVRADIPDIAQSDFEALVRATLNGIGARLGFTLEGDLVLLAQLESGVQFESARQPALPAPARTERDWSLLARLAIGLFLGLLLGVLGLPRLSLPLPALPFVAPRANPTAAPAELVTAGEVPVQPPAPKATVAPVTHTAIPSGPSVLLSERFTTPINRWPNDPASTAWFASGEYRLFARDTGRFVSVGVPLPPVSGGGLLISGQFHKIDGPPGGGYGFIIRDQGTPAARDGRNQSGQYLVLEVGDRGDIGVWRRDETRWIDIVPWTHSEAVHLGRAPNALVVNTDGSMLRFEVNGVVVAELSYDRLPAVGGIGIFAGGDLNEVALEWLRIETP
jgi:hypothetical protein